MSLKGLILASSLLQLGNRQFFIITVSANGLFLWLILECSETAATL